MSEKKKYIRDTGISITASAWRSKKAKDQPRDKFGRWVSAGANVKWKSHGTDWVGYVDKIVDGVATVVVKNANTDSGEEIRNISVESLRVMASKARINRGKPRIEDKNNDFEHLIGRKPGQGTPNPQPNPTPNPQPNPQPQINLDEIGDQGLYIQREDGYAIDLNRVSPKEDGALGEGTDEDYDAKYGKGGNPIMFQAFAPTGMSLGVYNARGANNIDAIIADHKAGNIGGGDGGGESAEAPVTASTRSEKSFTLPNSVIDTVVNTDLSVVHDEDYIKASGTILAKDQLTESEIAYIHSLYTKATKLYNSVGGDAFGEWVSRTKNDSEEYDPIDHDFDYYPAEEYYAASYSDTHYTASHLLMQVDDDIYLWDGWEFFEVDDDEELEFKDITPISSTAARELAYKIQEDVLNGVTRDHSFVDEEDIEYGIFKDAEDLLDYGYLSDISNQVLATDSDILSPEYTPEERANDANRQRRTNGGQFVPEKTEEDGPMANATYFAIVDDVDREAVLDVIVITNEHPPALYRRSGGTWVKDEELDAKVRGVEPPSVVILETVDEVRSILASVDEYDTDNGVIVSSTLNQLPNLLEEVILNLDAEDMEKIIQLRAKARSIGRSDVIPSKWRNMSENTENYSIISSIDPNSSELGAVNRFKDYWATGIGSEKWDNLQQLSIELSKYVGTESALGMALQIREHKNRSVTQ